MEEVEEVEEEEEEEGGSRRRKRRRKQVTLTLSCLCDTWIMNSR